MKNELTQISRLKNCNGIVKNKLGEFANKN